MRLLRALLSAVLLFTAASAGASPGDPKEGAEYVDLPVPQATDTGRKVEVIEFFAYYCPHCNSFEAPLMEWVKKQGNNIVFKRVHITNDASAAQMRLYYTLEYMGLLPKYHQKVYDAIHKDRTPMAKEEMIYDWAEKAGINRFTFMEAYRSPEVTARVRKAKAMMAPYIVRWWPHVVIDGKHTTSPGQIGEASMTELPEIQQQKDALQVMDYLVAKAKAEKK